MERKLSREHERAQGRRRREKLLFACTAARREKTENTAVEG
jgi:hypothetical protein